MIKGLSLLLFVTVVRAAVVERQFPPPPPPPTTTLKPPQPPPTGATLNPPPPGNSTLPPPPPPGNSTMLPPPPPTGGTLPPPPPGNSTMPPPPPPTGGTLPPPPPGNSTLPPPPPPGNSTVPPPPPPTGGTLPPPPPGNSTLPPPPPPGNGTLPPLPPTTTRPPPPPTTKLPTTIKPTTKPLTTLKPTTKPPTTIKPTTKPPTTIKVTTKPPTTIKPTTKLPVVTTTKSSATTTANAATTIPAGTYTEYQKYLISKATALAAAGTCNSVTSGCNNNCTTKATSLYYSWTDASYRYILLTGIPNHSFGSGAVSPNPNSACETISYMKLPLKPVKGSTSSSTPMGPVGAAVTGAYFYNTLSSPDGSLAVPNEGKTLDSCMGHSDPSCRYHYHSEPTCVTNYNGGCVLLGYWYDGFPIYSYCPSPLNSSRMMTSCYSLNSGATGLKNTDYTYSKTTNCDLDENNGYTAADGTYAYYMTSTYPWLPVGYSGTVAGKVCGVV